MLAEAVGVPRTLWNLARGHINWAKTARAVLGAAYADNADPTNDGSIAETSGSRVRMLECVSKYLRQERLTPELRNEMESLIAEADRDYAYGVPRRVRDLEALRDQLGVRLKNSFPKSTRKEAGALKVEIESTLNHVSFEDRLRYKLLSELLSIAAKTDQRADLLKQLRDISEPLSVKTERLTDLTGTALELSHEYERVDAALQLERNLPARLRLAYALITVAEADKTAQVHALTVGKNLYRQSRTLLREVAYMDHSLLGTAEFLELARRLGLDDIVRLAQEG